MISRPNSDAGKFYDHTVPSYIWRQNLILREPVELNANVVAGFLVSFGWDLFELCRYLGIEFCGQKLCQNLLGIYLVVAGFADWTST